MLKDLPAIQAQFNADLEQTLPEELTRTIRAKLSGPASPLPIEASPAV